MANPNGFESMTTPLLSSRTLWSAHGSTSSRVPLASSTGEIILGGGSGIPMSSSRTGAMRSLNTLATPSMAPRLPRPSSALGSAIKDHDAPPSTARRVAALKRTSSVAGLSQDSDQISSLKRQLHRTQAELEELRLSHSKLSLEASTKERKLEAQLEDVSVRLDRVSRERIALIAEKREREEKEMSVKDGKENDRRDSEQRERALKKELNDAKEKLYDLETGMREKEFSERKAWEKMKAVEARDATLETEFERLRNELEAKEHQLHQERTDRARAEQEIEKVKLDRSASGSTSAGDSAIIREELHRQVSHLRSLENENHRMKKRLETFEKQHVNIEVVKEANLSLERKVKAMDELVKKVSEQEAEVEALRREKKEWTAFLDPSDASEFSTPRKVTRNLAASRIENATFRQKVEEHTLELRNRDSIIGDLEEQVTMLTKTVDDVQDQVRQAETRLKQEQGRARLLQQEIDLLKKHLDSYNTEEAMQQAGDYDEQKTRRIRELEVLLETHKSGIAELEQQVAHWKDLAKRHAQNEVKQEGEEATSSVKKHLEEQLRSNETLREELDELRNSNELLEKEIEGLEDQIESLERAHGIKGAYNPETTRVLEFRDSPDRMEHAIRTSTLELLRNENSALVQRIADFASKAGTTSQVDLIPIESLRSAESTIANLRASVQQKETMLKRISSAMAEKTESLRLAVQDLLGFQLAFLDSGRIRITSLYAPSKDRSLAFDPWPGGPMPYKLVSANDEKVMKNDEVRRSVSFWLESRRSLPGFLASLTMTLYEETTRGSAGGVVYG